MSEADQAPTPNPDLQTLDPLVGLWRVEGGAVGTVRYEWLAGGFFLMQTYDLVQDGQVIKGIELIGHTQAFGAEPSPEIQSRIYDNNGNTFDYVYEVDGDTLTIWAGAVGSPAYYRATFSDDGDTLTGGWIYPGGGGYSTVTTRIK